MQKASDRSGKTGYSRLGSGCMKRNMRCAPVNQ